MKITKRQLRRIIREAEGSTKKYDDDSALRGKQSTLPDALQKGIIDKTVDDREEAEEEERLNEQTFAQDPELRELGEAIDSLSHWSMETNMLIDRMAERYGELVAQTTTARRIANDVEDLADRFDNALDSIILRSE